MASLCKACMWNLKNDGQALDRTFLKFRSSVEKRCPVCRKVWNILNDEQRHQVNALVSRLGDSKLKQEEQICSRYSRRAIKFQFHGIGSDANSQLETMVKFYKSNDEKSEGLSQIHLPCGIDMELSSNLLLRWVQGCIENHESCNLEGLHPRILPTRLVSTGLTESDPLHLCHTRDLAPQTQYLTLSHSWGTVEFVKLTNRNLNNFCTRIPVTELTKTFQDAISLTRASRIGYIWIDSLCIIQDSEQDWRHESALMADVYSNAWCNIAADRATAGRTGLFFARDPERLIPQFVTPSKSYPLVKNISAALSQVIRRLQSSMRRLHLFFLLDFVFELHSPADEKLWVEYVNESGLAQRAWVFQERLLAKRVLHFAEHQLFFECRQFRACETYPNGLPPFLQSSSDTTKTSFSRAQVLPGKGNAAINVKLLLKTWSELGSQYSNCNLTYTRDKLVTFSGIAREIKCIFNCDYAAGLWIEFYHIGLLWKAAAGATRPEIFTAPTWSWASLIGPITYDWYLWDRLEQAKKLVKLLNHQVETIDGNEMSLVISGYLRLVGHLIPINHSILSEVDTEKVINLPPRSHASRSPKCYFYKDIKNEQLEGTLYLLPVIGGLSPVIESTFSRFFGLVLKPSADLNGEFQRVGLIFSWNSVDVSYFTTNHSAEERKRFPEGMCEEYDEETSRCTFKLV